MKTSHCVCGKLLKTLVKERKIGKRNSHGPVVIVLLENQMIPFKAMEMPNGNFGTTLTDSSIHSYAFIIPCKLKNIGKALWCQTKDLSKRLVGLQHSSAPARMASDQELWGFGSTPAGGLQFPCLLPI